ncbi:MAG: hypothetical protein Q9227_004770 [Pyrenula ochraceoflavens]
MTRIIDECVKRHSLERPGWIALAESVKRNCQAKMEASYPEVPAMYSSRAKTTSSLREKLERIDEELESKTGRGLMEMQDVLENIFDMAGVRIALYFPSQRDKVDQMIKTECRREDGLFTLHSETTRYVPANDQGEITEMHKRRFPGYSAKHYRVFAAMPVQESNNDGYEEEHRATYTIEIQVVSVLTHAWAEIEHDIAYKKIRGEPTDGELTLLDGLRGNVITAEVVLEQLGKTYFERIEASEKKFQDAGALISCLESHPSAAAKDGKVHGRALLKLLRIFQKDTPKSVEEIFDDLAFGESAGPASNIRKQFEEFRLSPSIYVMKYLLNNDVRTDVAQLLPQKAEAEDAEDNRGCRILISSLLWLISNLFVPQPHVEDIFRRWVGEIRHDSDALRSLQWAIEGAGRGEIIDGGKPENFEHEHIQNLWRCFEQSQEPVIKFVFTLSCLGVQKNPESFWSINTHKMYLDCRDVEPLPTPQRRKSS